MSWDAAFQNDLAAYMMGHGVEAEDIDQSLTDPEADAIAATAVWLAAAGRLVPLKDPEPLIR